MMFKKGVLLILFSHLASLYGQNSLVYETYYQKFEKVQFSDPHRSKKYLDSILVLPKLADSLTAKTYNNLGIYHAVIGDYPEAIVYFKKALTFDKKILKVVQANILCNIANTQKMQGKFDFALQNYNQAKTIYTLLEDKKNIFKVDSELSSVYYSKYDFQNALSISVELIDKLEDFGDERLINIQRLRYANILFNVGDFDQAILEYKKTLPYFSKDIENNIQNRYVALMNIGECYSELNNAAALSNFEQALVGFKEMADSRNENICLSRIGKFYNRQKNYSKALPYLRSSFEFMYANQSYFSTEIFSFYMRTLLQLNEVDKSKALLQLDVHVMLSNSNVQEKIFYYETLVLLSEKVRDKTAEYRYLKILQNLYAEREKDNTFEELQKKLNQFNVANEIAKNKNLELKLFTLKLQNTIVIISALFLILAVIFLIDKHKRKTKIHELSVFQLTQEKDLMQRNNELKDIQLHLELDLKKAKERELTALQLKVFQIKSKVTAFLQSNDLKLETKVAAKVVCKVESFFENEDYWREFELRFTSMHPTFIGLIRSNFPLLTKKDIDFLILIKLNLSNKEIATLISISYESVISKRYLLRKKMDFITDNELVVFLDAL
ncbi:transcriptional regulator [Flavobacterium lacus]|uniref:DNA-binding CsgD family transcriptional regulator n=1 Tax=Flavobacterium lacus TaxID=1353778 RepID=A0A328WWI6_9FLAO|nr:transcriptional regulator [Flavobacterium lacus]RAR47209.1 DNA-binding CsgD family transcriptional regulator [Flavobacterium lacus]